MKVLITGANGLLGHHVVNELLERGVAIHAIVRSEKSIHFDKSKVSLHLGDFGSYKDLKIAATGCDAIIHIAAVTSTHLLHYEEYSKVNVGGAENVVKVAAELGIHRIVFVSTSNTLGYGSRQKLATESDTIKFPFSESYYAQSKVEAEKVFMRAAEKPNQQIVIIHPCFMIGEWDTKPSSGKLMLMGYKKRWMFVPNGGKNFVDASAVAIAIANALSQGKNGTHYLAAGVNLSFKEFYQLQAQVENYRQAIFQLPNWILLLLGKLGDILRKLGIPTDVSTMNMQQLLIREYYSNEKAKTELELPDTKLEDSIKKAINWFKTNQMIAQ